METKFIKFPKDGHIPKWRQFFTGAGSWLETLQILMDDKDKLWWSRFYVVPPIIMFCIELYVKAIASYIDKKFNAKNYSHNTAEILKDFSEKVPIFKRIEDDEKLFGLIEEYQKTIYDTRFGETNVSINGDDEQLMISLIYDLNKKMCGLTGLRN